MPDVFDGVFGQPQVCGFLRRVISSGHVGHAYLFVGPAGSSKTLAARAFSQSLVCDQGGCATCDACRRVERGVHPDVRFLEPQGANAYLIEQIRDLVADVSLAPVQATRKVYVLSRVDSMSVSAANAFLKTLEEPPADVVFILLGRTSDGVLPTIASRCQIVPFRHIPPHEAAAIISQKTGVTPARARVALEACDGSITRAVTYARSNERLALRQKVFDCMASLEHADSWDIIASSKGLVVAAKAPLDAVRRANDAELAEQASTLETGMRKQMEQQNKRMLSALEKERLVELLSLVQAWLGDMLVIAAGSEELVINEDVRPLLIEATRNCTAHRIAAALQTARHMRELIAYNVSAQTCVEALMLHIKEDLYTARTRV